MGGRRKTSNIPPGQRRPALQPAADKLDLAAAAKRAADDTEVRAALAEQGIEPPANDDKAVLSAYDELLRQASAYERAAAAARERTGAAADAEAVAREREQLAADARAAAEADRRRLAAAEDELKGRLSRFTADEAHLKVRGDEVTALEREARDGFAAQARAARLELEAELDLRRQTAQLEAEQQRRQLAEEHAKQTALLSGTARRCAGRRRSCASRKGRCGDNRSCWSASSTTWTRRSRPVPQLTSPPSTATCKSCGSSTTPRSTRSPSSASSYPSATNSCCASAAPTLAT
ncbi:hypothetical protein GCM10020218_093350 [Dactylosporangium vinaceum]